VWIVVVRNRRFGVVSPASFASHHYWRLLLAGVDRGRGKLGCSDGNAPIWLGLMDIKVASVGGLAGFWSAG
jgi:hypothetical protein